MQMRRTSIAYCSTKENVAKFRTRACSERAAAAAAAALSLSVDR